ncbi:sodium:solute symporter family protein [Pseudonocardia nigra]|uniref:sodium:solute symporter family protein n=1 Tax=Pseudonocardia nigra TaxID=1921578 RepID=UPI001C5D20ED|nr:sodium:solute symporter family protein [Pseudonocardia nigra]
MFAAGVIASFVLYLVIGAVVGRKVKTRSDYYVAGRNAPTLLVAGTLVASFLSTVSFMGELGFSYDGFPVVMLILTALNISGYVLGVLAFGRYLRRSEALTVPEFFGRRFDSPGLQAVAGLMVVAGIGLYLVAVTQGLSLVVAQLLDVPEWSALVIVWAAYTVFTLMSGTKGVMINDTIMFGIFMIAGVVGMSWIIGEAGGPGAAVAAMTAIESKPDALTWHGVTGPGAYMGSPTEVLVWALTLGVVWATVVAVSPWQSSRYLMARNEHVCLRSGFVAMGAVGVLYVFLTLGGFAINIFNPDIRPSEIAFIWAAQNVLPTALGVVAVTGIVAAGLSSAAAFLSLIGFSAAHDVLPWLTRRRGTPVDDASALRTSRIAMLGAGVVVLLITFWSPPAVLTIGYFAATLFAAAWGPVAIWCIRSARLSTRAAMAGMIAGFGTVAVLNGLVEFGGLDLPVWADPVLIGFTASIVATWLGGLGRQPAPAGVRFREKILHTPAEDRRPRELRTTRTVAMGTAGVFAVTLVALVAVYAVPVTQQLGIGR